MAGVKNKSDGENPTITLPAAAAKNRTESVQPLRLSARALSRFSAGRGAMSLPSDSRPPGERRARYAGG